jgi:transposase-like protein
MRYPASEKLEIIRLVEQSHLPVRRTLATLGILPGTFYRWYGRLQSGGPEALEDRSPRPRRVWNRIPDDVREQVLELALDEPELSPRELATRFTDLEKYFIVCCSVGTPAAPTTTATSGLPATRLITPPSRIAGRCIELYGIELYGETADVLEAVRSRACGRLVAFGQHQHVGRGALNVLDLVIRN